MSEREQSQEKNSQPSGEGEVFPESGQPTGGGVRRHEVHFTDDDRDKLVADDAFVLPSGWVQAEIGEVLRYLPPHMVEELVVEDG